MALLGTLGLIMLALSYWRRKHHKHAELIYKYKIYAFRDRLRYLALTNSIDQKSWIFDYFDYSFSKAVGQSYFITLFRGVLLYLKHNEDEALLDLQERINHELENNPELKKLQDGYIRVTVEYALSQHLVSAFIVGVILSPIIGTGFILNKVYKWFDKVIVYPETSGSMAYCRL